MASNARAATGTGTLTAFRSSSTIFAAARPETIKAASDRFGAGSPEVNAVAAAWGAVLVS